MERIEELKRIQANLGDKVHPVIGQYIREDWSNNDWDWEYLTGHSVIDGELEKVHNGFTFIEQMKEKYHYDLISYEMICSGNDVEEVWVLRTFKFKAMEGFNGIPVDDYGKVHSIIAPEFDTEEKVSFYFGNNILEVYVKYTEL